MKANISKIEEMIKQLGNTSLNSLKTWFPDVAKKDLISLVEKSNNLFLIDNEVVLKINNNSLDVENLSFEEVIDIIDTYNDKEEKKYNKLNSQKSVLKRKIDAIKKHLKNYYTISPIDNNDLNQIKIYSLKKIGTTSLISYAIIVDKFTKEALRELEKIFSNEAIFIYYISSFNNNLDLSTCNNDYYQKDAEKLLKKYLVEYQLERKSQDILKITTTKGVE